LLFFISQRLNPILDTLQNTKTYTIMKFYTFALLLALVCCVALVDVTSGDESLRKRELSVARNTKDRGAQGNTFFASLFLYLSTWINDKEFRLLTKKQLCTTFGIGNCICTDVGLRIAIKRNQVKNICINTTITVSREIDITGKNFTIGCDYACPEDPDISCDNNWNCSITGTGSNRLFSGSPVDANFKLIDFSKGSADNGGVASLTGGATFFSICRFSENKATANGGAIFASGSSALLSLGFDFCVFFDNKATANGGAIFASGSSTLLSFGCDFFDNKATANGGAIFASGSSTLLSFEYSLLGDNLANNGGAVYIADGATLEDTSATYHRNTASTDGGAVSVKNSEITFSGGSFSHNSAVSGGALAFENGKAELGSNVKFQNNTASAMGSDIWIADDASPTLAGSSVICDSTSKVEFCGSSGISEFAGGLDGTQLFDNTNCDTVGSIVDPSSDIFCRQL
jgi:predicted outer membrane repeat protein